VKFTVRGSIAVEIRHFGANLIFRVQDTGVGIASDKLDSIFEKFVQADASMTRRHGGSGLGLTICRDLVALMGGDIRVESVEGAGTTFIVELPLRRAEDTRLNLPLEDAGKNAAPDSGMRILVAEDNPTNQLVLLTLLRAVGLAPAMVSNGQEALERWRDGAWDLVLMDIQMPVMDGVTTVRRLREIERREGRRRTPVIAVTANVTAHQRAGYLAAGMDEVVAKPIDLASLLGAMEAVLGSGAVNTAAVAA
jgi:CheY-like chemotaxis protein